VHTVAPLQGSAARRFIASPRPLAFPPAPHDKERLANPSRPESALTVANVFSIPAGAPFLATLARALLGGELVAGFPGDGGPLELAKATIYLPTQRAAAAFGQALVEASGGASLVLPRIAPLGAFEPHDDLGLSQPEEPLGDIAPEAVGELTRRMTLARLTRAWGEALRGAICRVEADGRMAFDEREPPLVATSPAQAYALAGDLAALIDDMIIEGVDPERLGGLVADAFDPYWRITLDFLKIAFAQWPAWLAERGRIDRARRGALLIDDEIEALAKGASRGPTIIAGSTGTNRATARLIAAIARASQGAVVLPDLDQSLNERAWTMIGASDEGAVGVAGHPQAAFHRLLATIGVARGEVKTLGAPSEALRARAHYLSEALRPADATDAWSERRKETSAGALSDQAIAEGLADVAIVVADDENEEALALAVAMREALETPGRTAALITPNVTIARRVSAELLRWGVEVEDSAGRTLGQTEAGAFARLALAATADFAPAPLVALFAHPLTRLARAPEVLERAARALEIGVFRAVLPPSGLGDIPALIADARDFAADRHAHDARKRLDDDDWRAAEALLRDAAAVAAPLRALGARAPLGRFIAAHRAALDALARGEDASADEAWSEAHGGEALNELFDEWADGAELGFACGLADYAALFDAVLSGQRAPVGRNAHPRLQILGLLEARLLSFDLALVAGLDETIWPPAAETDAFLNRSMRASLGLSAPERRIGQTAHDFVAALGAPRAIVSRARKRGGAPTVASRFLQRMGAVADEAAMKAAEDRGQFYIELARGLDRPERYRPAPRPEPRPPRGLRPDRLSVTRIETLRRDPYAVYAESILRLRPLEPIGVATGPREVGDVWHAALQEFSEELPSGPLPADARARLLAIARARFAPMLADPSFRAMHWPRIERGLDAFLAFDAERRAGAERIFVEQGGRLEFPLADGSIFTLTARADRIEVLRAGGAALIDYKSGSPPGTNEVQVGFAPQLTLEAAMLARGGFAGLVGVEAVSVLYFKLGGVKGGEVRKLEFKGASFAEVVERHFAGLKNLLDQFADPSTPYLSRLYPKFAKRAGDYDHLARVKEWSATGGFADGAQGDEL
jgi:ATP-dependent helicase/nuclease subunit B